MDNIISFLGHESTEEWREFWESMATTPDGDTTVGVCYSFPIEHRYIINGFRALCENEAASARILEVGCGNGLFSKALFGTRPVIGVDYSLGMCRFARARGLQVYHADAMSLPFADGQFDLIYSAEILQYIDDLLGFLAELARVCRPGGRIVVSTLNRLSLLGQTARTVRRVFPRRKARPPAAIRKRSAEEMVTAGAAAHLQFRTIVRTYFPFPWRSNSKDPHYLFDRLANNVIVEFNKPDF